MLEPNFSITSINPFGLDNVNGHTSPTLVDIDNDGDLDLFVGDHYGYVLFFKNMGSTNNPVFSDPVSNAFGLTKSDIGYDANITFVDIDDDGDLDAFVEHIFKKVKFYRNTGSPTNPVFSDSSTNPYGLTGSPYNNYNYVDIDSDDDLDAFFLDFYGDMRFYQNTGTSQNPEFSDSTANPFGLYAVGYDPHYIFVDIDSDGDLDAFVGTNRDIQFFINNGTPENPKFGSPNTHPFGLFYDSNKGNPSYRLTFGDIDGDGDLDAFTGHVDGETLFTNNAKAATDSVSNTLIKEANDIFLSVLSDEEKLLNLESAEQVGLIRVMADMSKAAYHLEEREDEVINDFSDFADDARIEVLAQGWQPVDLGSLTDDDPIFLYVNHQLLSNDFTAVRLQDGMSSNGFYTNGNAAAYVVRSDDAIVLSFRGTNDNGYNPNDEGNHIYPDKDDWSPIDVGGDPGGGKEEHYGYLQPLISALDNFVSDRSNGINKVYVTGHSLGGAMATHYMETHKNIKVNPNDSESDDLVAYSAVTFAAPSYGLSLGNDPRITHIEIQGDLVPDVGPHPGRTIRFEGNDTRGIDLFDLDIFPFDQANHSMDYYRQITKSIDAIAWLKILEIPEEPNVLLGADNIEISEGQTHDTFIVDGLNSDNNKVFDSGNDELIDSAAGTYDFLYGGRGEDSLTGGTNNDFMYGGSGNDSINGSSGVDTAFYSGPLSSYVIQFEERLFLSDQLIVADQRSESKNDGTDTLKNIERVIFSDLGVAFDLDGSAGNVAKLIGVVFGAGNVSNANLVGIGLAHLDSGTKYEDLAALALSAAGAKTNEQVVNLLYTNLIGVTPTQDQAAPFVHRLDNGVYSKGSLGVLAAETPINQANIGLIGLTDTGIAFDLSHYNAIG